MNAKLFFQAIDKFNAGPVLTGLLLFLPAGSLGYRNAWLLIGILLIPIIAVRMKNEEKVLEQEPEGCAAYQKKVRYKVVPFIR